MFGDLSRSTRSRPLQLLRHVGSGTLKVAAADVGFQVRNYIAVPF